MDEEKLARELGDCLKKKKSFLATAESCTGGWVSTVITSISGSSAWFDRGFVTYSNQAKQEMLGVSTDTLAVYGAVSVQTATEMAEGVLCHSIADYSLAVTGTAGPEGGTQQKPVGTVCFAWAGRSMATQSDCVLFKGDRHDIRLQSVQFVLMRLIEILHKLSG